MSFQAAAIAQNSLQTAAVDIRRLVEAVWQQTGVVGDGDMLVAQQASPNGTVQVAAGEIVINASGSGLGGYYFDRNDAALTSPAISPTSTNGRKDRLIARVTSGVTALEVVQGTASASPAEPSITGDNFEELALITLPSSTTNVTNAMITDRRNHATARAGQLRARGANYLFPLYSARMYRSAAWTAPIATTVVPFDTASFDYNTNLTTGAAAKYTAPVGGLYRVSARVGWQNNANNPESAWLSIFKNGSEVAQGTRLVTRGATTGDDLGVVVVDIVSCAAADTVDIRFSLVASNGVGARVGSLANYMSVTKV